MTLSITQRTCHAYDLGWVFPIFIDIQYRRIGLNLQP